MGSALVHLPVQKKKETKMAILKVKLTMLAGTWTQNRPPPPVQVSRGLVYRSLPALVATRLHLPPTRSPPAGCLRHRPAAGGAAAPRAGVCRGHPGHGGEPAVAPHRPRLPPGVHPRTCCRLALRCLNRKCTPKQALALPKRRSLPCGDVKWRPTTPAAMPWNTHLSLLCAFLQCERISISR